MKRQALFSSKIKVMKKIKVSSAAVLPGSLRIQKRSRNENGRVAFPERVPFHHKKNKKNNVTESLWNSFLW